MNYYFTVGLLFVKVVKGWAGLPCEHDPPFTFGSLVCSRAPRRTWPWAWRVSGSGCRIFFFFFSLLKTNNLADEKPCRNLQEQRWKVALGWITGTNNRSCGHCEADRCKVNGPQRVSAHKYQNRRRWNNKTCPAGGVRAVQPGIPLFVLDRGTG